MTTGGTTTGGTTTGGTTAGTGTGSGVTVGTVTGGTVSGGTVTGGTVTGGTVTGGTVTGGTAPGSGTSIVTMTGFEPVGGFFVPVLVDRGDPDADGAVLTTVVEAGGGAWVTAGLDGVVTEFGAGLTDGVGVLVAECCFGTMISGLPPPVAGVEPKYEPATG